MSLELHPSMAAWAWEGAPSTNILVFSPVVHDDITPGYHLARDLCDAPTAAPDWPYFMLQASSLIDPDDAETRLTHVEIDAQGGGNYYDLASVRIHSHRIEILFREGEALAGEHSSVVLHCTKSGVPRGLLRFFADGLYLGSRMEYAAGVAAADRVVQSEYPIELEED